MIRSSVVAVLSALAVLGPAASASAVVDTARYPDLKTLPPRDLVLDRTDVSVNGTDGIMHNVLRFSNTVVNGGDGPLMLQGIFLTDPLNAPAVQHLYDAQGNDVGSHTVGEFTWHQAHQHFHFVDWGRYELWTAAKYDAWVAAGRPDTMAPDISGSKTTSCIEDEEFIDSLPGAIWPGVYQASGCGHGDGTVMTQGLSVGWGDTYDYYRQDQWIDLDQQTLADGRYVLRSVVDPFNNIYESSGKADGAREGPAANEAVTRFGISNGMLVDGEPPTGTVFVNGVARSTDSTQVTVRAIGRDDVSGVARVRVSNDGTHWATYDYGGIGSEPMVLNWDLADTRYGGSYDAGTRTVYAQFLDRAGNWGPTETDTIDYTGGDAPPPAVDAGYGATVRADHPVSWWRLGEATGPVAHDTAGPNDATYDLTAGLGAPGLLSSDPDAAAHFDGHSSVDVRTPTGLDPTAPFSLEAWIHPEALPAAGSFASVATRPGSYSLQFNGPKLEWTVIQNGGSRHRLQVPAGTVVPGQTYHVVGTYDGTTQRLYINGQQAAVASLTGPVDPGSGMHIGSWDGGSEEFTGTIDEVAFYHQALPGLQVTRHYQVGHAATVGIATPTGLSATASTGRVDLTWTDNASNETGYVVQRATSSDFVNATSIPLPAGATSYPDTGRADGTTYWYRVQAVSGTDSSAWSAPASATTPTAAPVPPAAPSALKATAAASDRVDLSWADNASDETGYVVERASGSDFAGAADIPLPAGATSYADTGRTASTAYWYRVRAVGAGGPSAWSDATSATTPAVPVSPPPPPPPPPPTTTPDYAPTVLADAPVGYWRLDETTGTVARDARKLHNGTYLNAPALGAPALLGDGDGHAVSLDGVNDRVAVAGANAFTLGKAFTLEAWVRPAWLPADGSFASLVTRPESYSLQLNGARLEFTVIQNGVRRRLQAAAGAIEPGGTYHVVGTYNGARQRLYVNGREVANRIQTGAASAVSSSLNIGSWDGTGEFLGGVVDEVAVYNAPLSAAQVLAHYDAAGPAISSAASLRRYAVPRRRTRNAQSRTRAAALRRLHRRRR